MNNVFYLIPAVGLIALVVMMIKSAWVSKQDAGNDRMKEIAGYVAEGAMAFLKAEYRILAIFMVIAGIGLGVLSQKVPTSHWLIVVAFVVGCVFSALAGFFGMKIATKANVRTTEAARTSLAKAVAEARESARANALYDLLEEFGEDSNQGEIECWQKYAYEMLSKRLNELDDEDDE